MRHGQQTPGRLRRAFSLVELLTVIAVITLLASLAFGINAALRAKSHRDSARVLIRRIETALEQYRDTFGNWPSAVPANTPDRSVDQEIRDYIGRLGSIKDVLLGAEAVQPSEVRDGVLLNDSGNPIFALDKNGKRIQVVVDFWRNPINVIHSGHNSPGLDIWSNGPDWNDGRDPNNRKAYGDDEVNW